MSTDVSFTTEQDYIVARDAVLDVLKSAEMRGTIRAEVTYSQIHKPSNSTLEKLAFDIVSAIARSNIPVTGDITDYLVGNEIDFSRITV